eukprot:319074-Chlamydomonas_euryale.AAC.1
MHCMGRLFQSQLRRARPRLLCVPRLRADVHQRDGIWHTARSVRVVRKVPGHGLAAGNVFTLWASVR